MICIQVADLLALGTLVAAASLLAGFCCALRIADRLEHQLAKETERADEWETAAGQWMSLARQRSCARREVARA
ncbi:MAG TPA: hypothetical protein VHM19_23130 [Polyangiales bacterium]|jgi:hypothetical protein|nr:hypothetical protein [Polyangiales bacterium]